MNNKKNIKDLFDSPEIEFCIPDYQRAYSWESEKQVKQFMDDIKEIVQYKKIYYLGHFLFERDEHNSNKYYIIDGQQRLTTVIIFMQCAYNELKLRTEEQPTTDEDINHIKEKYIKSSKLYKFSTISEDKPFFERVIYNGKSDEGETNSQKRIISAKKLFVKTFRKADTLEILQWKRSIEEALITCNEVEGKFQATQIFAFHNDRGKPLTELEKLKAEIMHKVYTFAEENQASEAIDYIRQQFTDIYKDIERLSFNNEDTILNYHANAFFKWDETAISHLKKEIISTNKDKIEWLKRFTDDIRESYKTMRKIEDFYKSESKIVDCMLLDKTNSTPLLLKLFHYHENDIKYINDIAEIIEIILFKMTYRWADFRTNNLIPIAKNYKGEQDKLKTELSNIAQKGFKDYWDFNTSCLNYFSTNTYHYQGNIKYVLWKYENYLRKENRRGAISAEAYINQYNSKRVENTLDHITPQTPDFIEYSDDFKKKWLNNIGNLSLMGWGNNSAKNNQNPVEAKEFYKSDYYSMHEIYDTLCERKQWTENEIKERRDRIIEFIKANWKIEDTPK